MENWLWIGGNIFRMSQGKMIFLCGWMRGDICWVTLMWWVFNCLCIYLFIESNLFVFLGEYDFLLLT